MGKVDIEFTNKNEIVKNLNPNNKILVYRSYSNFAKSNVKNLFIDKNNKKYLDQSNVTLVSVVSTIKSGLVNLLLQRLIEQRSMTCFISYSIIINTQIG